MARVTLRQLLDHAAEHGYGVPAFNINNMEQGLAIMEAAKKTDSPVIIQASRGARSYAGDQMLAQLVEGLEKQYPDLLICLHQDHGNSEATCASAIRMGFDSVMMDGSLEADGKTPSSYEYNTRITSEVAKIAHWVGASVEGELGCLGSLETGKGDKEDGHGFEGSLSRDMLLTDPVQAREFVLATKVDALAVAIGTSHGAYKFTRKPTGDVLAMNVIEAIHAQIPNVHLVMHGSSSVLFRSNSLGSYPLSRETARIAFVMLALTMRIIPRAAATGSSFNCFANFPMATPLRYRTRPWRARRPRRTSRHRAVPSRPRGSTRPNGPACRARRRFPSFEPTRAIAPELRVGPACPVC